MSNRFGIPPNCSTTRSVTHEAERSWGDKPAQIRPHRRVCPLQRDFPLWIFQSLTHVVNHGLGRFPLGVTIGLHQQVVGNFAMAVITESMADI